ncbi:hypothetical protein GR212_15690 [Rhizobium lusitanum]|uniref:Uncharacterized protein n=1 Tax=Rhizobium lusitanum TaxID=293958 RepID=A0A6L9U698_9HYPH|nr:hypothetical protein [Rhizobium lusitanum]NEI71021.1 hypothetical protein [Rhizobium lusitanum]
MKVFASIRRWLADVRYRRLVHQVALHHHRAGAIAPYAIAAHELYLRRKLEDFRDFASQRYIEERSLTLNEIKQEWLNLVVKPMAKSEFTRDDAKALKAAIVAIGHNEAFVGEARAVYQDDLRQAIDSAKQGSVYKPSSV